MRGVSHKTGTPLPVRTIEQEAHCEKFPFNTGADDHAVTICSTLVDDHRDWRRHAPRSGKAFFAYFLLPPGQKVRRGAGRSARGFDSILK
jgi:hypothetical protein